MSDKPTITDALVARLRDYNPGAWGSLHIVMEDGNVRDGDVEFCIQDALKLRDWRGAELACVLRQMSRTQRRKLYHVANYHTEERAAQEDREDDDAS